MNYNLEELIAHIRGVQSANDEIIRNWDLEGENKTEAQVKFDFCTKLLRLVNIEES